MGKFTLKRALTDPDLKTGVMLPVLKRTIPIEAIKQAQPFKPDSTWQELYLPTNQHNEGTCKFGCKVFYRSHPTAVVEYAVMHSLSYGHSHSPNQR